MKIVVFGLILTVVFAVGLGSAYSQTDTIPEWIKGVAGFWAEDKITDSEFIEALEFLIESNVIQVDDPRVGELEKENSELREKLESKVQISEMADAELQQEPIANIEVKPETAEMPQPHIITDKQNYSLGDTVHVTGKLMKPLTKQLLNGTLVYPASENINIRIITPEKGSLPIDNLGGCMAFYPYDVIQFNTRDQSSDIEKYGSPYELGKYYHHDSYYDSINSTMIDIRDECGIDDGIITGSFEITGDFTAGTHMISYLHQSSPTGANTDRYLYSAPFIIQ